MFEALLPIAASSTDGGLLAVLGIAIGAIGGVVVGALTPFGDWIKRKDGLKTYRRNVYRNFLDHAYWYRDESLSSEKRQKRAEKYVADWHRIQLIGGKRVQDATENLRNPGSLQPDEDEALIQVFKRELGVGGLG